MPITAANNTFDTDLSLLDKHFTPIVLSHQGRRIAVLSELQGRIMHASTGNPAIGSIGWLNREQLIKSSIQLDDAIGGADRLWFGPDGGRFSIFFDPNAEIIPENIRPPKPLTFDTFLVTEKTSDQASFEHQFKFKNHLGFEFETKVERTVSLLSKDHIEAELSISIPNSLDWVAYGSQNTATNISDSPWKTETGLFSLWALGMFEPEATVVIPLNKPLTKATNYFVPPSDKQFRIINDTLFYNADAKLMNKIGVPPEHTQPLFGSYDHAKRRLTIITFSFDPKAAEYVNAVWDWQAPALNGEVINVFNDGPQANGKPFGPFYEMETSSPALKLAPGESATHKHNTHHFIGEPDLLNPIAQSLLGVSLEQIQGAFNSNNIEPKAPNATQP